MMLTTLTTSLASLADKLNNDEFSSFELIYTCIKCNKFCYNNPKYGLLCMFCNIFQCNECFDVCNLCSYCFGSAIISENILDYILNKYDIDVEHIKQKIQKERLNNIYNELPTKFNFIDKVFKLKKK